VYSHTPMIEIIIQIQPWPTTTFLPQRESIRMACTSFPMIFYHFTDVHIPSPLTKDILENYFADDLFVICLNLFDKYQNLFDNSFYTIPKTMSWDWRHMSTAPTSLNNLNVSSFCLTFVWICLIILKAFTLHPLHYKRKTCFPVSTAPTIWIFNFFFTIVLFDIWICLTIFNICTRISPHYMNKKKKCCSFIFTFYTMHIIILIGNLYV
jgi:hypothetical protein